MTTTQTKTPVTLFLSGGMFGPQKLEGWLLEHGRKPYAQYPDAPFVKFVPKGKRTPRGWVGTFKPFGVILAGHGLPVEPASWLVEGAAATPSALSSR